MDVAKNFASWRDQSPEQWIARANHVLPPIVVAVLVVAIAYQAASLTRRLLEAPAEQAAVPVMAPATSGPTAAATGSYDALHGWKPFGEPPAPGSQVEAPLSDLDELPTTTLPLDLWGTNGASREEWATATIAPKGRGAQQLTYFIGDTIENANGAKLYAVFPTQVVIEHPDGRREILPLPNADQLSSAARGSVRLSTSAPAQPQEALTRAVQVQETLTSAAASLSSYVRIAPAVEGGQLIGFRLTPSSDPELFAALGFEPGDVLMEVNGVRLNDPNNQSRAFSALTESSQAQATIRRNDQQQTIVVDLTMIQRMMESRE